MVKVRNKDQLLCCAFARRSIRIFSSAKVNQRGRKKVENRRYGPVRRRRQSIILRRHKNLSVGNINGPPP
jgi:hypothetical protein